MGGAPRGARRALGSGVCPSAWSRAIGGWGGVIVLTVDVSARSVGCVLLLSMNDGHRGPRAGCASLGGFHVRPLSRVVGFLPPAQAHAPSPRRSAWVRSVPALPPAASLSGIPGARPPSLQPVLAGPGRMQHLSGGGNSTLGWGGGLSPCGGLPVTPRGLPHTRQGSSISSDAGVCAASLLGPRPQTEVCFSPCPSVKRSSASTGWAGHSADLAP